MIIKKIVCAVLCVCFFFGAAESAGASAIGAVQQSISAKAFTVIDGDTLEVIYSKNSSEELAMASTTKIMTALLCLEREDTEKEFAVDGKAVCVEGTSMGLAVGERINLKSLVIGMLLLSGNDAANAAAVRCAGSCEAFVNKMNERAAQIGMKNTIFSSPSGLEKGKHFSTAYDMALLAACALKNKMFAEICSKKSCEVVYNGRRHVFRNHNRLLSELDGCIGVKTGFTKKAGRCLVSAVKRHGRTLICVTLHAPDDWNDHKKLYESAFSLYKKVSADAFLQGGKMPVVNSLQKSVGYAIKDIPEIFLRQGEKLTVSFVKRDFEYAPIFEKEPAGAAIFKINGKKFCSAPIVFTQSAHALKSEKEKPLNLFEKLINWLKGK